jgi:cytochrome c peroxidase
MIYQEITISDPDGPWWQWADIGKLKGPMWRGLSARPRDFHNGSSGGVKEVIKFYDTRFEMALTEQEKANLIPFLSAL